MKILKSKKALSPVVASIILIAVTVAVSIAVAAWMGALTIGFMGGAENVEVLHIKWGTNNTFTLEVKNAGTSTVNINYIKMNALQIKNANGTSVNFPQSIGAGVTFTYNVTSTWKPGDNYDIGVVTSKGTPFTRVVTGGVDF
jgi:flagellin-like protein